MNANSPHNKPANPTVADWLKDATAQLKTAGINTAQLDAELILAHTLRKPRTWLHGHGDEILNARHIEIAHARLDLRIDRVPVAYIIGHKEFYGHSFKVTTATLIPRPESEDLLELLNQALPTNQSLLPTEALKVLDVGTGSGCLGISAKLAHPELDVTLIDTSRHALKIAEENAINLRAPVTILHSDLFGNYPLTADIIIANLPYVDPTWERSPETDHEPASALFAAQNGLSLIFELLVQTKRALALGGKLILEADPEQHPAIKKEAARYGLLPVTTLGYGLLFDKVA